MALIVLLATVEAQSTDELAQAIVETEDRGMAFATSWMPKHH